MVLTTLRVTVPTAPAAETPVTSTEIGVEGGDPQVPLPQVLRPQPLLITTEVVPTAPAAETPVAETVDAGCPQVPLPQVLRPHPVDATTHSYALCPMRYGLLHCSHRWRDTE